MRTVLILGKVEFDFDIKKFKPSKKGQWLRPDQCEKIKGPCVLADKLGRIFAWNLPTALSAARVVRVLGVGRGNG